MEFSGVTILFFSPSQLNDKEDRESIAASPGGSASGKDSSDSGEGGLGGGNSSNSSSSDEGSNDGQASGRDESSPKVDVMN
jgi:hypothetical protein